MKSMIKKIVAVMAAVVMAVTAAVSVSAEYLNVDKYGIYDSYVNLLSAGNPLPSGTLSARWALSGVSPDYTYDCWIQIVFADSVSSEQFYLGSVEKSYYSNTNSSLGSGLYSSPWNTCSSQLGSIEKKSDKSYIIHLYWNSSVCDYYSATLQLAQQFGSRGSGNVTWIGQGVGVYYDPGGDIYSQLIYEYGQGNPLPDVKDIKDQGAAMSTAEAAVRDKSSDLVSSVDSEWTGYQTDAKALATTLKPAATQINNLYATITAELPDEVKALFIAIPILLFIGWLIGRVRE